MVLKGLEEFYDVQLARGPYAHYVRIENKTSLEVGVFETRGLAFMTGGQRIQRRYKNMIPVPTCGHHPLEETLVGRALGWVAGRVS